MKAAAALCFVGVLALAGVWFAQGQHMATLTERPVEVTNQDEFGDDVVTTTWESTFEIGLDYAGPGMGLLGFAGVLLWWRGRRAA